MLTRLGPDDATATAALTARGPWRALARLTPFGATSSPPRPGVQPSHRPFAAVFFVRAQAVGSFRRGAARGRDFPLYKCQLGHTLRVLLAFAELLNSLPAFPIPADAEPADAALGGPPILAVAALGAPPRVAPPRPPGAATYPTPPPPLCGRWPPGLNTTSIRLRLRRM